MISSSIVMVVRMDMLPLREKYYRTIIISMKAIAAANRKGRRSAPELAQSCAPQLRGFKFSGS
jgi:hypothetical protein